MVPDSSVPPSQRQRSRSEPSLARALPIVFVALALAVLPTLAAASPPDPAWIGGIYDAADGDEIVTLIGDQAGSLGVVGYAICQPLPLPQALHEMGSCTAQGFSRQRLSRGPPTGSCTSIAAPPLLCTGPRQPTVRTYLNSHRRRCSDDHAQELSGQLGVSSVTPALPAPAN